MPGARTTITVSTTRITSTSLCPTPTVSTIMKSNFALCTNRNTAFVLTESPPRCPRVASERMKTPGSVKWSVNLIRSPRSAPPDIGEDGSTARTATEKFRSLNNLIRASTVVDFPTPGAPVIPITCVPALSSISKGRPVFSIIVIAFANACRSPLRTWLRSSV